jgi:hypothetical protein
MRDLQCAQGLKVPGAAQPPRTNPAARGAPLKGAAVGKPRTAFQELCYGIPVDLIAVWCCVDIQSARHYKAGTRSPGKPALELFRLNLDGRVLPAEWQGFSFRGGKMWDPYGKELSHSVLRAYPIALQLMREWARGNDARTRALDEILYTHSHALPSPAPSCAHERSEGRTGAEAKPSALVRYRSPETHRRRNRQRAVTCHHLPWETCLESCAEVKRSAADERSHDSVDA